MSEQPTKSDGAGVVIIVAVLAIVLLLVPCGLVVLGGVAWFTIRESHSFEPKLPEFPRMPVQLQPNEAGGNPSPAEIPLAPVVPGGDVTPAPALP